MCIITAVSHSLKPLSILSLIFSNSYFPAKVWFVHTRKQADSVAKNCEDKMKILEAKIILSFYSPATDEKF